MKETDTNQISLCRIALFKLLHVHSTCFTPKRDNYNDYFFNMPFKQQCVWECIWTLLGFSFT